MGAIELHTWNATTARLDHPDPFVLDLDPDPALPWKRMIEATQLTLAVLDELGLTSFLKTSGGKGLHLVVPLTASQEWAVVKEFTQALVQHMARQLPDRSSAVSGPRNRVGRIFIDYLRNGQGVTTIAPYAVRARAQLPVSVPLRRDELTSLKRANQWTIANLRHRLAKQNTDPWHGYVRVRQTITAQMRERIGMKRSA